MTLYRGRYRIESARLAGWDYSAPGWYFVTICTRDRACVLGEVRHGVVHLSPIGRIVAEEWVRTCRIRPYVRLDAWVIMPNHLHGIIRIGPRADISSTPAVETPQRGVSNPKLRQSPVETPQRGVSTMGAGTSGSPDSPRSPLHPRLPAGSVGAIIGQFKSACTKRVREAGHTGFGWQPRFHDRVIRDAGELDRIRRYIAMNPARWERDRNRPDRIRP